MDQVYLFKVEGGQMLAFPMGEMRMIKGSGDYGIGHVTMYIGDGKVVHASSSSTGIIVSDVDYRTPVSASDYIGD